MSRKKSTLQNQKKQPTILLIHGPNFNVLEQRNSKYYPKISLQELCQNIREKAKALEIHILDFQSNSEATLIDWIHKNSPHAQGRILNLGAFTHSSPALRDALTIHNLFNIEVHLSNIYHREPFRQTSFIRDICEGFITGLGVHGYFCALDYLKEKIEKSTGEKP